MAPLLADMCTTTEDSGWATRPPTSAELAAIQVDIRHAVVTGENTNIAAILTGGKNPGKRLEIHRRHYESSLVTALLARFPATIWLAGSACVSEAAKRYIREHPPRRPCIAEYGETFPEFLSACSRKHAPYLPEFAELEWHVGDISIAIDHPPLPADVISKLPEETLPEVGLSLQPGLRYVKVSWPVDKLMNFYLTDTAPESLEFVPEDRWLELRGARGQFRLERLTCGDFIFRRSIVDGGSLGDAAESALDADGSFDPGRALAALIADGLITTINLPRSTR